MKKIDFIYKNFDINAFSKNLKKIKGSKYRDFSDFLTKIVIESTRDISQIKKEINYYQFTKSKPDSEITKHCINFLKKFGNNYSEKDIEKYFFEQKNILNMDFSNDYEEWENLFSIHVNTGEFFRKFKKHFEIIYYGQLSYMVESRHRDSPYEDIYCLHVPQNNRFYLFFYGYEEDGNDSFDYVRSFKSKPSINKIKTTLKDPSINLHEVSKKIKLSKFWLKELKSALNFTRQEKPFFSNEKEFLNSYRGDKDIEYNYVIKDPIKYFKNQNPLPLLKKYWKTNETEKIKRFKFLNYIMSDKFNYRNSSKFIFEILHLPDDFEGLLNLIPKKNQQSKMLAEEIRILKMLRTTNKEFLVTIFNKNKDKLYALALNYMPKKIFDDPFLVMKMIKIDPNIIGLIGEKLRKNKKFMKKVWKD